MKKHFVCILSDSKMECLTVVNCIDIRKMIELFKKMPYLPPNRQNVLVYVEGYESEVSASINFDIISKLTKAEKIALIEKVNPQWFELVPGVNLDL